MTIDRRIARNLTFARRLTGLIPSFMIGYQMVGDQYVGRTVSGLPLDREEFASLPPFFHCKDQESRKAVDDIMKILFPNVDNILRNVAEQAVASVVYHEEFLQRKMGNQHPFYNCQLFLHAGFLDTLRKYVTVEPAGRKATGIPVHMLVMNKLSGLQDLVQTTEEKLGQILCGVRSGCRTGTQPQAEQVDTEARSGSDGQLLDQRTRVNGNAMAAVGDAQRGREKEQVASKVERSQRVRSGKEGNAGTGPGVRKKPTWTPMTSRGAWIQWHFEQSDGCPPMKTLKQTDLQSKEDRERFSDLRLLMNEIEEEAKALGIYKENPTMEEADFIYEQCENYLFEQYERGKAATGKDSSGFNDLTWMTMVQILRKNLGMEGSKN
eukprot:571640-Hanusia_phi.AAC.10